MTRMLDSGSQKGTGMKNNVLTKHRRFIEELSSQMQQQKQLIEVLQPQTVL